MVQLPAMNTPQFSWVKSRLPNQPKPVPPIFQPEVAAEAIVWAAQHDRREPELGVSTVEAIVGNKFAPGLLDWYLARTAYAAQQTDQPADPDRPNNLWQPVDQDIDYGARGDFGAESRSRSWQWWASTHRRGIALVTGAGLMSLGALQSWRQR
jgi:hypothetical protein